MVTIRQRPLASFRRFLVLVTIVSAFLSSGTRTTHAFQSIVLHRARERPTTVLSVSTASVSDAAAWHQERRRAMMKEYGGQIAPLEKDSSQTFGIPLLGAVNLGLVLLALNCGKLSMGTLICLSILPGSILSLWQLQILHDVVHGSFFDKKMANRQTLQDRLLFWGSMPSVFGYYLYLKCGHLSHHKNVGSPDKSTLDRLFDSDQVDFEDGDVLFVAHRMKLKGDIGPKITLPGGKEIKISISNSGFRAWKTGNTVWNSAAFAVSFFVERFAVAFNDILVAIMGRNLYFPNKPDAFHKDCATYARCALVVRGALWAVAGWKALFFLYLSETLWSIPPHPACAMFVTNHGSVLDEKSGECIPTSSTYAGRWYQLLTLNTALHTEHHDFPNSE